MARRGKYRERITIQTPTDAQNSYGEVTQTWATHASRWASIRPARGNELLLQDEFQGRQQWIVECPFVVGLSNKMRITWSRPFETTGRTLNIDFVQEDPTHRREHIITCTELIDSST